jgi:chromosome segregation ATPase
MEGFYLLLLISNLVVALNGQYQRQSNCLDRQYIDLKFEDAKHNVSRAIERQKSKINRNAQFVDNNIVQLEAVIQAADKVHSGLKNENEKLEQKIIKTEKKMEHLELTLEQQDPRNIHQMLNDQLTHFNGYKNDIKKLFSESEELLKENHFPDILEQVGNPQTLERSF